MAELVPYKLELYLPVVPTPLNVMLRMHHFKRAKISSSYKSLIKKMMKGQPRPLYPLESCQITIVRHYYRYVDWDNCVASYKTIMDILVKNEQIIVDDNYKVTGPWTVTQEFRPKNEGPLSYVKIEGLQAARSRSHKKILKEKKSEHS